MSSRTRPGLQTPPAQILMVALIGLVAAGVAASVAHRRQQLPADFFTVRDVPLPGDTSRFD